MAILNSRRIPVHARVSSYRPSVETLEARTAPGDLLGGFLHDPLMPAPQQLLDMPRPNLIALMGRSAVKSENVTPAPMKPSADQDNVVSFPPPINGRKPGLESPGTPANKPGEDAPFTSIIKPGISVGTGGGTGTDKLDPPGNVSGGIIGSGTNYVDILISWTYNDLGAKLFQIDRSTSLENHVPVGKVDFMDDADVTHYQFIDRGLPKGPTYHYWVKAVNGFNQSPWSEVFIVPTA